jgi:hypothetical protein
MGGTKGSDLIRLLALLLMLQTSAVATVGYAGSGGWAIHFASCLEYGR